MPVRVPIQLRRLAEKGQDLPPLETSGLVNTGFEAERLECSLPTAAAARLGLWPKLPASAIRLEVDTYGGKTFVHAVPDALQAGVLVPDRSLRRVTAWAIITAVDDEVILSDALAEELELVAVKPKTGLWVFADEAIKPGRPSVSPEFW